MKNIFRRRVEWIGALLTLAVATTAVPRNAAAQDQQGDDPPSRVARLGFMEGSVSFDPAGQQDWVEATPNRPMTTGDKLWADKDSRAELQLGSASIRLSANTGMSFLNLDDRTAQIQLTSGTLNVRVRRLNRDDVFEIDTPNQAFSVYQPGSYRLEASEDGTYTIISVREGQGESTGNGQTFTLHQGQKGTFSGTETLNAEVDNIGEPDQFDNWAYQREHRYEGSRSAHYLSPDVVGYEDLDDNGDWRDESSYGHVWFPNHVEADWAPYHDGHWAWVAPWGWTWVDDAPWGYAPFHYGRWVSVSGRWGWVAGPVDVAPVYAPALVVFVGGGIGAGVDVGWFPLGPREVYVPTYNVSREYVNRVNISNTTVTTTTVTNVYNTTIVNNRTNITNVNYVNRNVQGAVTAVPQRAFVSAQPVARAAVKMDARQMASAPVMTRVALAPSRESVLGAHANTANHVTVPPAAVANRQVIAKSTPPPPPVPFAKQQQMMAAHPGVPPARHELRAAQPATTAEAHPMVKIAPPGKPTQPNTGHPGNQPGNQPNARPGMPANQPPANQPGNRPGNQLAPNERPGTTSPAQPNRPQPNQPNRPEANRPPAAQPNNRPEPNQPNDPKPNRPPAAQPNNRPEPNQPNRPEANRPPAAQPNNRPEPNQPNRPEPNRPPAAQPNNRPEPNQPNRPEANRPPAAQPNNRPEPNQPNTTGAANRPPAAQPNNRPEPNQPNRPEANRPPAAQPKPEPQRQQAAPQRTPPPAETRPAPKQQQKPETPQEKKKREQEQQKPPGI